MTQRKKPTRAKAPRSDAKKAPAKKPAAKKATGRKEAPARTAAGGDKRPAGKRFTERSDERVGRPSRDNREERGARAPLGNRTDRPQRTTRSESTSRNGRPEKDLRSAKPDRGLRSAKPERDLRSSRPERDLRSAKPERELHSARPERSLRSARPERDARSARPERTDRPQRGDRFGFDRAEKAETTERTKRTERFERSESARPERARTERARPERARPEGARPERARPEKTGRERAPLLVWGRRPVEAMLADLVGKEGAKVSAYSLFLLADKEGKVPAQLRDAVDSAKAVGIRVKVCKGHEDETWPLLGDEALNHQRLCLIVPEFPTVSLHDVLRNVREKAAAGEKGCLGIVFDQVQDPRNFGSVLRSAAFFGASFAIFGEDRQAALTSTVIKASAGGAFSLQLAPVVNLNRALAQLKEAGVWVVGSSLGENAVAPEGVPVDRPYVLVLGNEGKGMRQEVARNCDYVVRIPGGNATVDSLNVGVAAGILLARLQSGRVLSSTRV